MMFSVIEINAFYNCKYFDFSIHIFRTCPHRAKIYAKVYENEK